jgi:hypothetical protein
MAAWRQASQYLSRFSSKSVSFQNRELIHRQFQIVCRIPPVSRDMSQIAPYRFRVWIIN